MSRACSCARPCSLARLRNIKPRTEACRSASKAVTARAKRTESDTPLNSSARKRLSSGAFWLNELKLRQGTPRGRAPSARRQESIDTFRARPISEGTPRDEAGAVLKPNQITRFFEEQQRALAGGNIAAVQVDPMMYVTRGEMSDFVQRL